MLVYSPKPSFRLNYILNLLFKELLGINYSITQLKDEFILYQGPKLCYSTEPINNAAFIASCGLLFESGIREQNIAVYKKNNNQVYLYKTNHFQSLLPFDIFAASFYLVSRYEEYLPHIRDKYDRFEADSSIAFQHNFLQIPIVNSWLEELKEKLVELFPALSFSEKKYSYTSTIDIDNAYAFKQKGVMRTLGGYAKALLHFHWKDMTERTKVLLGKLHDPYDTYGEQLRLQQEYNLKVIYFFLLGDYGVNDKNLPSNNSDFQSLIKHLADYAVVGIHPSYGSNNNSDQVKKEINRLSAIVHTDIKKSRQHFLKIHFPETYKSLIENGITSDYSMGYASQTGFRAGICHSFNWYDLESESETNLRIHPFAVMDATFRYYLKVKPEEVPAIVEPLVQEVKKAKGEFISIWHNETISNWRDWENWQKVYEEVIKLAR